MSRPCATLLVLGAALGVAAPARAAYCPSYTKSSPANDHNCGVDAVPGTNPSAEQWQDFFLLVSQGPEAWGAQGPAVKDIGQGCGKPEPLHDVPARFPCELLKAIAMAESGWQQFCAPTKPPDQVGKPPQTIISFDCGYGVSQVTSGMHTGETPAFDRDRVAGEALYNLATGASILAGKWRATKCVGDNQPRIIEHWYTAAWAYNGLAYVNNPNNPNYDPDRGVWDPAIGGAAPYQEKIFGRLEHTQGKWPATEAAYPNPGDIGNGNSPPDLPEPSCASPTDCASTRPTHETSCAGTGGGGGAGGSAGAGGEPAAGGAAGAEPGGGAPGSGGAGGAGAVAASPLGALGPSDGGCDCRASLGASAGAGSAAWAAALALVWLARGRRRRRAPVLLARLAEIRY
ncbi:MAG: hypothetical protein HY744_13365 [Deltaproteobacteria bacterium]|nr:hypothetical protein [Deltaproteobacteria bacterium]